MVNQTVDEAAKEYAEQWGVNHSDGSPASTWSLVRDIAFRSGAAWQLKQIAADVAALRDDEKLTIGQAVNKLVEKWGKK